MTVNEQIGMEAARVFQALTKGEIIEEVDHLMVAPKCLAVKSNCSDRRRDPP